jgi:hypothetical protein
MTYQWLIERGQPEGVPNPVWLQHDIDHPARDMAWTTDAWHAAMFPDRAAAESWIAENSLGARAVEHGFMDSADVVDSD